MKFKKLLSLAAAAAISASAFAGLCVTASAASDKTLNATLGTVYTAEQLYDGDFAAINSWTLKDTFSNITPSDSFGTTPGDFTSKYQKYVSGKKDVNTTLNVTVDEAGTYLLEMLCQEYNTRYPKVTVNETTVFSGAPKDNTTDATYCVNYDLLKGGNEDRKIGTFTSGSNTNSAAIVVLRFDLNSGTNTIHLANINSKTSIQGLIAVVLNKVVDVPATGIEITAKNINTANLILKPTETIQLTGKLTPDNATTKVTWSSSDEEVATVSNGMVTAVASGTATITATAGELSATSKIEVLAPSAPAKTTKTVYAKINCTNATVGGNKCDVNTIHKFIDGADEEAKAIFADSTYGTVIDNSFMKNYVNYIVGTSNPGDANRARPSFKLTVPRGTFRMYVLGRDGETDKLSVTIDDKKSGYFTRYADFAKGADATDTNNGTGNKVLDLYVLEFTTEAAMENVKVTFDNDYDKQYLPDMYAVAVAGTEYVAPTPQETPAEGKTFTNGTGNAAAAYNAAVTGVSGTIKNPQWVIRATKDGKEGTATVEIDASNTEGLLFSGANVTFGLVIKDIAEGMTITGAKLVYTVD